MSDQKYKSGSLNSAKSKELVISSQFLKKVSFKSIHLLKISDK